MVSVAYTDLNGYSKKYASKLVEADKTKYKFYCPNPKCRTEMSLNIFENKSNFFSANMKNKNHIEGCWASKSELNREYSTNDYNTKDFIENLMLSKNNDKNKQSKTNSSNIVRHKKLSTLKDIFIYCRTHDIDEKIRREYIRTIFLDDRNMDYYNKHVIFGYKMISPTLINYNLKENEYNMFFRYGNVKGCIKFMNKSIMKSVLKKLDLGLDSCRKPRDIRNVIAAKWKTTKKDDNGEPLWIEGKILNTKQIIDVSSYEI